MKPQNYIPTERIIHYIVKDYQRMFNGFHAMRESKDAYIDELLKKLAKKSNAISNLQAENKRLRQQIKEVQASRNEVAKAVSEDLAEQLKAAKKKVKILVQALDDPNALNKLNEHIISSDDDKIWMDKAMKQLEKALLNFTAIQARLVDTSDSMGKALEQRLIGGDADKVYNRFAKVFPKIDACVSHIEDFFTKIGNIKIENNG